MGNSILNPTTFGFRRPWWILLSYCDELAGLMGVRAIVYDFCSATLLSVAKIRRIILETYPKGQNILFFHQSPPPSGSADNNNNIDGQETSKKAFLQLPTTGSSPTYYPIRRKRNHCSPWHQVTPT